VSEVVDYDIVNDDSISYTSNYNYVFVSLNRYERKKRLDIAIDAFQILIESLKMKSVQTSDILLVIAGGFDDAVDENLEVYDELVSKAEKNSLSCQVVFRKSISNDERLALLQGCAALLYTPDREHFGIVPIEAMAQGIPVIAVSSGGPLETVEHGVTGYLCEQTPEAFSGAMEKFVTKDKAKKKQIEEMGIKGRERVARLFSKTALKDKLEICINKILTNEKPLSFIFISLWVVVLVMFGQFIGLVVKFLLRSIGILST
jgi:alpha-1,3/alpha-1,6-mannosyltransferase